MPRNRSSSSSSRLSVGQSAKLQPWPRAPPHTTCDSGGSPAAVGGAGGALPGRPAPGVSQRWWWQSMMGSSGSSGSSGAQRAG